MENTVRQTRMQKRNGYLLDQELIVLARQAVREYFSSDVIETSTLEVRYSVKAMMDIDDGDEDTNASIWFVHHSTSHSFMPGDIARANIRLWEFMEDRGDFRRPSMFHGYKSDPRAVQQAA